MYSALAGRTKEKSIRPSFESSHEQQEIAPHGSGKSRMRRGKQDLPAPALSRLLA